MTHDPFAVTDAGHMGAKGYAGGAEMDPNTHYPKYQKASRGDHGGAGGAIDSPVKGTLPAGAANLPKDSLIFYHPSDAADQMQTPNGLTSPIAAELSPKLKPHDASSYAQPPVKGDADSEGKPGRVDPTL
jgi:hypothetical protein